MFTEELEGVQFYISRYQRDGRPLYLRFFPGRSPRFILRATRSCRTGESAVAKPGNFVPGGWRGPTGQPYAPCARLGRIRAPAVGGPPWGVRAAPVQGSASAARGLDGS